jgi:hypothetical protein
MSDSVDELSSEERRLVALLALLRSDPATAARNGQFVAETMRTIRWQRALRGALRTIGHLATAVSGGVSLILGRRSPR